MAAIDLRFTTLSRPLPGFIADALRPYADQSNTYHHQPEVLRDRLAAKHHITSDMIHLTAGIDQAILAISALYGRQTHIFTPTYICYQDARLMGGTVHEHHSLANGEYAVSPAGLPDASLIFLANPNNPAGTTPRATIIELIRNNPAAKVIVDEAYGEYVEDSVVDLVTTYPNMLVTRSFSKGYSLAGFRIGYVIGQSAALADFDKLETLWFNTAHTSVGAAVAALEHEAYFAGLRQEIVKERQLTETCLMEAGYTLVPSKINAVLLRFSQAAEATAFTDHLQTAGILANQGNGASNVGLDKSFVRVSIGTPAMMEHFREVISTLTA